MHERGNGTFANVALNWETPLGLPRTPQAMHDPSESVVVSRACVPCGQRYMYWPVQRAGVRIGQWCTYWPVQREGSLRPAATDEAMHLPAYAHVQVHVYLPVGVCDPKPSGPRLHRSGKRGSGWGRGGRRGWRSGGGGGGDDLGAAGMVCVCVNLGGAVVVGRLRGALPGGVGRRLLGFWRGLAASVFSRWVVRPAPPPRPETPHPKR